MPPTFGDTRPIFGYAAVGDAPIAPIRPSIGSQLGMDGTELPATEYHAHPCWMEAHDFEPGPDGTCAVCAAHVIGL